MINRLFMLMVVVAAMGLGVQAQEAVPVISGAVGFLSTTNGGTNFLEPIVVPVLSAPLGDHFLIEARGELLGFFSQNSNAGLSYQRQYFSALDYAQVDYTANSWLTIVAGRFLTPFGIYNERLTPIWIHNMQDSPLILPIGTR